MKKLLIIFFLIFLIFSFPGSWFFPRIIQAQEFNFEKAYSDYIYTLEVYKKRKSDFELARSAYLKNPNLKLQSEAQSKTASYLSGRDELLRTYLTALRLKLRETQGLTDEVKNSLYSRLDGEVSWYQNHSQRYSSSQSLDDLVSISDESENHWQGTTERLVYELLYTIALGKTNDYRDRQTKALEKIKTKVEEIKTKGDKKTTLIERWYLDVEAKFVLSQQTQSQAGEAISKLNQEYTKPQGVFTSAMDFLKESLGHLNQANSFLKEIILEIKKAD